jgi:histidinol-phosphate aminotransferase
LIVDEAYFEYVQTTATRFAKYQSDAAHATLRTFPSSVWRHASLWCRAAEIISMMRRSAPTLQRARPMGGLGNVEDRDHVQRTWRSTGNLEPSANSKTRSGVRAEPWHLLVRVGKGQKVFKQLLSQGVIVRPMGGYQFPEHVRVTVGTMAENRKFIGALQKVIKNL